MVYQTYNASTENYIIIRACQFEIKWPSNLKMDPRNQCPLGRKPKHPIFV